MEINSIVGDPVSIPSDEGAASPAAPAPASAADPPTAPATAPAAQQDDPATQQQPTASEPQALPVPPAGYAPMAALHEERQRRREAEQRAQQFEALQRQFAELQRAVQPAPTVPDPNENPLGYFAHEVGNLRLTQQQMLEQANRERQQAQAAAVEARLASHVQRIEQAFVTQTPDYPEALSYVHGMRTRELQALGADPLAAEEQSARELREFALVTTYRGGNAPAQFYELAKARGYARKAPTPAAPAPAEQLQAAQKGVAAAASLGGGGGTAPGQLDAKRLAAMSDEEFAAVSPAQWRKAMGG